MDQNSYVDFEAQKSELGILKDRFCKTYRAKDVPGFIECLSSAYDLFFVKKTNHTLIQLFRYTFVGGIAFIFDFGTLFSLTHFLECYYLISAAIAFILGLTINYSLSIRWVFQNRNVQNRKAEFLIFAMIGLIGLGLNELIIWLFTEVIGFHYLGSKIVSTIVIYLFNFTARKLALFK